MGGEDEADDLGREEAMEELTEVAINELARRLSFAEVARWLCEKLDPQQIAEIADGTHDRLPKV